MKPLMKILVAYDGSAHSEKALDEAISVADKFRGNVVVLHVAWNETDQESRRLLRRAEDRLKDSNVRYELKSDRSEYVPRRIVRVATDEACDLIMVGCRGLSREKSWVLGSVSSRVLEDSPVPVLVIK
ncbi:MAG: universal stress protein [Candidatus Bathyarchaeota archaeon]|nr:universal stress protein [Candidatus Bathyarchaeota archaeon]